MSYYHVNDETLNVNVREENTSIDSTAKEGRCPCDFYNSKIVVRHQSENSGYSLFTNSFFRPNDVLFEYLIPFSELRKSPDKHSIQVAEDWHWCTMKHPIQYTQHSTFQFNCKFLLDETSKPQEDTPIDVDCSVRKLNGTPRQEGEFGKFRLIALNDINPGTAIAVNYNTFEWDMVCSFVDATSETTNYNKNAAHVKGRLVSGFKNALPDEQKLLIEKGLLLKHIEKLFFALRDK